MEPAPINPIPGMICAAILRAEEVILAGFGGFEPRFEITARQDVSVQTKVRDEETVDHVLRDESELYRPADRNVKLVDLALTFRVLKFPHPLLRDDVDLDCVGRRANGGEVEFDAPEKDAREDDHWRDGPRPFHP